MARRVIELMDDMHLSSQSTFLDYYHAMQENDISYANSILLNNPFVQNQIMNADNINVLLNETYRRELVPKVDIDYFLAGLHTVYERMILYTRVMGEWDSTTQYNVHNLVYYQGKGYFAYTNEAPPIGTLPTNTNYWLEYDIRGFQGYGGININFKFNWDNTQNYKEGDVVIFQNKMWYAIADNTNYEPNLNHYPWVIISMPKMPNKTPIQKIQPTGYDTGDFWFQITQGEEVILTTWEIKTPEPTPRFASGAFTVDNTIYVVGGILSNFTESNINEAYDTEIGTWSVKASIPTSRARVASFSIGTNGYVIGGIDGDGNILSTVEMYDSTTNTWTTKRNYPIPIISSGTATNTTGYIIGGETTNNAIIADSYSYNPNTDMWTKITDKPTLTYGHTVATDGATIYAIGGIDGNRNTLAINEAYDIATGTWAQKDTLTVPRSFLGSFAYRGTIYAVGGLNSNWYSLNTNEKYDILNNEWTEDMPMNYSRSSLNVVTANDKGYVIGGIDIGISAVNGYLEQYNEIETFSNFEMIINTDLSVKTYNIITEDGDNIITESGDNIVGEVNGNPLTVSIPMVQGGTYNYYVDWGDGTTSSVITSYRDDASHTYAVSGEYTIKLIGSLDQLQFSGNIASYLTEVTKCDLEFNSITDMFKNCRNLTSIVSDIFANSLNLTSAEGVLNGCISMTVLPVGLFDNNTNITSFKDSFKNTRITNIPTGFFDSTNLITDFSGVFQGCINLVSIPNNLFANTNSVNTFAYAFYGCKSLTTIANNLFINTPIVTSFDSTFANCSSVTTIPSNLFGEASISVSTFHAMFKNTGVTTIPEGLFKSASAATNYLEVFSGCNITAIPNNCFNGYNATFIDVSDNTKDAFDRSKIISIGNNALNGLNILSDTFKGNTVLTTVGTDSLWSNSATSISNVPSSVFYGCTALTSVGNINLSVVSSTASLNSMFSGCTSLTTISGFKKSSEASLQSDISFADCPLTYDSLINISNSLVTNTPTTVKTLTLGTSNLAKLSDVEKLVIINKYWNLVGYDVSTNLTSDLAQDLVVELYGWAGLSTNMYQETSLYYYIILYDSNTAVNYGWYAVDKTTGYTYEYDNLPQYEYYIETESKYSSEEATVNSYWVAKGTDNDTTGAVLKAKLEELNTSSVQVIKIGLTNQSNNGIFNTSLDNIQDLSSLCSGFTYLKQFIIYEGENSVCTTMESMFNGCTSLIAVNFGSLKTSNCTNMSLLFNNCSALTTLSNISSFNTSKVNTMQKMFYNCSSLSSFSFVESWANTNVTTMESMFNTCTKLTSMPNIKMTKVTNGNYMYAATGLTSITANRLPSTLQTVTGMFSNCKSLITLPSTYTSIFGTNNNLTKVNGLFQNCTSLKTVGQTPYDITTGEYTSMTFNITKAKNQVLGNCPNVTDASYMFSNTAITDIPVAAFYNNPKLTTVAYAFKGCTSMTMANGGETDGAFQTYNNLLIKNTQLTSIAGLFQGCTELQWFGIETVSGQNAYYTLTNLVDASYLYDGSGISDILFGYGFPMNSKKLTTIDYALRNCPIYYLGAPFDSTASTSFPALKTCKGLFYNCTHLGKSDYGTQTNAMPFINSVKALPSFTSGDDAFYNCTNISDYSSIPTGWK